METFFGRGGWMASAEEGIEKAAGWLDWLECGLGYEKGVSE